MPLISELQKKLLKADTARIIYVNNLKEKVYLWTRYEECYKCNFLNTKVIEPNGKQYEEYKTYYTLNYIINTVPEDPIKGTVCLQNNVDLKDQSQQVLSIGKNNHSECNWEVLEEGQSNTWIFIVGIIIVLFLAAIFYLACFLYRRFKSNKFNDEEVTEKISQRLKSLDSFRGFTMLSMIFVNWGAGGFHFLDHAEWDGMRFADFIFPFFIFIMGVTMAISLRSTIVKKEVPLKKVLIDILLRSIKLLLLGIILGSDDADVRYMRIPGVLQRFALSYFFVATTHAISLYMNKNTLYSQMNYMSDIVPYWPDWILSFSMLIIHFSVTYGWKFDPNCPRGYVGPGGLYDNSSHPNCVGGAANKLDKLIFTEKHIYKYFTAAELYNPNDQYKLSHDPEGLLGVTTSIVLTFIGLQVGKILLTYSSTKQRLLRWSIWALVLAVLTAILAGTNAIPINKNLWSFTFVTVTGSSAIVVFGIFYILIDHFKVWPKGKPFHYPGMNSILLYMSHSFAGGLLPFSFLSRSQSHAWRLTQNFTGVFLMLLISFRLYRKKIFFTL